ncbi:MAG: DUF421 domain-containing protein [Bacilli bacterium]|nr:DUF421 domain-containing protein [Bacilli bacterium]
MYIDIIIKTFILYFLIVLSYRIMGKKEVGELSIIDLIVTILIAELAAICIEETKRSIFVSIVPIIELVIIQISLSYISMKNNKIRNFLDGRPSIIIKKGKVCFEQMTKLRYSLDDLISQLREKGIKSIEEVDYAVLENSGTLSVFQKTKDYPMPIILDGIIDFEVLKEIKKDKLWLYKLLEKQNLKLEDVFYAFYTKNKTYIIKKSDLI